MPLPAKAVLAWFAILVAMFANGTMRVLLLQPMVGEARARQWACLTGVCIVVALSGLFVRALPKVTARQLLTVGASWLALTLAFEFLIGHFVAGMTWTALLEDYDLLRGRLWVFVLLATFLSPWFWGVMRSRRRS